jgi:hypothetical protein
VLIYIRPFKASWASSFCGVKRPAEININFDINNDLCYIQLFKIREETWAAF